MKLTKAKLIKKVNPYLQKMGYKNFPDTIEGSQGLFGKKIDTHHYLMIGLTIHRSYESAFTGSYYFSKTTRWASMWGDIPKDSYKRPSHFLNKEELSFFVPKNYFETTVSDLWWDANDEEAVQYFIKTIEITEPRIINNSELRSELDRSTIVTQQCEFASNVISAVKNNTILNQNFNSIPKKEIDKIPIVWFKAAEYTLIQKNSSISEGSVQSLAADAYRQYVLDNIVTE